MIKTYYLIGFLLFIRIFDGYCQDSTLTISKLLNNCRKSKSNFDTMNCCRIDILESIIEYESITNKWPNFQTIKDSAWNKCDLDLSGLLSYKGDSLFYCLGIYDKRKIIITCVNNGDHIELRYSVPQKRDSIGKSKGYLKIDF